MACCSNFIVDYEMGTLYHKRSAKVGDWAHLSYMGTNCLKASFEMAYTPFVNVFASWSLDCYPGL